MIAALLIGENNNELLIKNHMTRPTVSKAFPEANTLDTKKPVKEYNAFRGRGCGRKNNLDEEENTIHKIGSHFSGSALSNPLREKNTKDIPPISQKMLVSDAVLRDIGLAYVVPLHIFVLYSKCPSKGKANM